MRRIALILVAALAFTAGACTEEEGTEFRLSGQVTDVRADAEPGVEIEADTDDEEGEPDGSGAIQVRTDDVEGDLGECDLDEDAVPVFFTANTDFDPPETVDDGDFPENLAGAGVEVEGRVFGLEANGGEQDGGCALVADEIELEEGAAATASPATGGGVTTTPSPPSPTPTGVEISPTPTVGETFIPPTSSP